MAWFTEQDVRIYYEESGKGEPVLFIPGWGGSIGEFGPLLEVLARQWRVVAADPPGCGRSEPRPRQYPDSFYEYDARLYLALLDHLRVPHAHLMGFSDGGEYALLMAILRPSIARSIVTWGSCGQAIAPPGMLDALAEVVDNPIPPLRGFSEFLKSTYGVDVARAMAQGHAGALKALMARGGDISRQQASQISCPCLLITGEKDFLATPQLVAEIAGAVPRGSYLEVKDAGHDVHRSHGELLVSSVGQWLART